MRVLCGLVFICCSYHAPRVARVWRVMLVQPLKIVFVLTVLKQCIIHTATASSRGRRSGSASGEMPPVPMAIIQPTSAADPGVQKVGDDGDVRVRGFEAAAERLPEKRPALELADHMFDPLPHRAEVASELPLLLREVAADVAGQAVGTGLVRAVS